MLICVFVYNFCLGYRLVKLLRDPRLHITHTHLLNKGRVCIFGSYLYMLRCHMFSPVSLYTHAGLTHGHIAYNP